MACSHESQQILITFSIGTLVMKTEAKIKLSLGYAATE
jgi:hypothetical protein